MLRYNQCQVLVGQVTTKELVNYCVYKVQYKLIVNKLFTSKYFNERSRNN